MALTVTAIQHAIDSAAALVAGSSISENARVALLAAAQKLVASLEKPEDAITKLAYSPTQFVAVRTCLELGIFREIDEAQGPVTSTDLAQSVGADKILIERLLRILTASGVVREVGVTTYTPNALTKSLNTRKTKALIEFIYDLGLRSMISIPEYLRKNDYRNPEDNSNGPFQFANGVENQNIFHWLGEPQHEKQRHIMHAFFEADRGSRPDWVDWFPVREKLLQDVSFSPEGTVLVDVAGGRGHEIDSFVKRFPDIPGRYILQDLPEVVQDPTLALDPVIEKKSFNFWKDTPVTGARIYYLKFIMHDWNDEKCLQILGHVTSAMTKGFSTVVIEDFILPDTGCHQIAAMWDLEMMSFLSAMERTKAQWQKLLDAAGLQIEGFYQPPGDGTAASDCPTLRKQKANQLQGKIKIPGQWYNLVKYYDFDNIIDIDFEPEHSNPTQLRIGDRNAVHEFLVSCLESADYILVVRGFNYRMILSSGATPGLTDIGTVGTKPHVESA